MAKYEFSLSPTQDRKLILQKHIEMWAPSFSNFFASTELSLTNHGGGGRRQPIIIHWPLVKISTCVASSLVGARTSPIGNCFLRPNPWLCIPPTGPFSRIRFRMGTRNAAVLPLPVWAHAIKSLSFKMTGIAFFCKQCIFHEVMRFSISKDHLTCTGVGFE